MDTSWLHDEVMARKPDRAQYWDAAYGEGDDTRGWYQLRPAMSLQMLDAADVCATDSVLDVGGGASPLAGFLIDRGFADLTVLDISATSLRYARQRLGPKAERVRWLTADVLTWRPERQYQVWHDRAVFHFLTDSQDRRQYLRVLHACTAPAAAAVFGCFAPDGPRRCSGLPVIGYAPQDLAGQLGSPWMLVTQAREEHVTPWGATQPFAWSAFRRQR
jgi:SAM-dependent methyltransferase